MKQYFGAPSGSCLVVGHRYLVNKAFKDAKKWAWWWVWKRKGGLWKDLEPVHIQKLEKISCRNMSWGSLGDERQELSWIVCLGRGLHGRSLENGWVPCGCDEGKKCGYVRHSACWMMGWMKWVETEFFRVLLMLSIWALTLKVREWPRTIFKQENEVLWFYKLYLATENGLEVGECRKQTMWRIRSELMM